MNRISVILEGENRGKRKEEITKLVLEYFVSLYSRDTWDWPTLDNLHFDCIGMERTS